MTATATPPLTPTSTDPVDQSIAALTATGTVPSSDDGKKSDPTSVLANIQGAQLAAQVANWAAQLEFAKERFRLLELPQYQSQSQLQIDQLAFQKASTAWQQAFEEASLTGTYQGQTTTAWLTQQAQLTGTLNGSQTLQGKLSDAQINQMNTAMQLAMKNQDLQERQFGFQQTQWNAEFALSKAGQDMQYGGYTSTGAPTIQREQVENQSAQQYLTLLASLRGPKDAFAQARVIGNTPNSIRDIANAWLGKYQIGGTTGSGMNPTPINGVPGGGDTGFSAAPTSPYGTTTAGGYTFATPNAIAGPSGMPVPNGSPLAPYVDLGAGMTYPQITPYTFSPGTPTNQFIATPGSDGTPIPGRGLDPSQWNDATRLAVQQWNNTHPGFQANGSQLGYGYTGPVPQAGGTFDFNNIPGRGLDPSQWNPATQQAVAAWNATHPGYVANGSQTGYALSGSGAALPPPDAGGGPAVHYPEPASGAALPPPDAGGGPAVQYSEPASGVAPISGRSPDTVAATAAAVSPATASGAGALPPYTYQASNSPTAATATTSGAGEAAAATYSPPGATAPAGMYNYTPTASGGYQVSPPGVQADPSQHQMSTSAPASSDDLSTWFSGVLPNQINAKNFGNMNEYNQTLGWAAMEDQGWDIGAAQDAFKKSLPRYSGPSTGSYAPLG